MCAMERMGYGGDRHVCWIGRNTMHDRWTLINHTRHASHHAVAHERVQGQSVFCWIPCHLVNRLSLCTWSNTTKHMCKIWANKTFNSASNRAKTIVTWFVCEFYIEERRVEKEGNGTTQMRGNGGNGCNYKNYAFSWMIYIGLKNGVNQWCYWLDLRFKDSSNVGLLEWWGQMMLCRWYCCSSVVADWTLLQWVCRIKNQIENWLAGGRGVVTKYSMRLSKGSINEQTTTFLFTWN